MGEPALAIVDEAAGEQAAQQTVRLIVIEGGAGAAEAGGAVAAAEVGGSVAAGEVAGGAAAAGIGGAAVATAGVALVVIGLAALGYYLYKRHEAADSNPKPALPVTPELVTRCASAGSASSASTAAPGSQTQSQPSAAPKPGSGSKCDSLNQKMLEARGVLRDRINDLLADKLDLYHLAYDIPNLLLPPNSGTWVGHLEAAKNWQNRLRRLIKQALRNKCAIPPGVGEIARRKLPTFPRGT
jgi:hypothetical protein